MSEQKAKPVVVSREQAQTLAEQNPDSSILLTLTAAFDVIDKCETALGNVCDFVGRQVDQSVDEALAAIGAFKGEK